MLLRAHSAILTAHSEKIAAMIRFQCAQQENTIDSAQGNSQGSGQDNGQECIQLDMSGISCKALYHIVFFMYLGYIPQKMKTSHHSTTATTDLLWESGDRCENCEMGYVLTFML